MAVTLGTDGVLVREVSPTIVAVVAMDMLPRYRPLQRKRHSSFVDLFWGELRTSAANDRITNLRRKEAAVRATYSSHG